MTDEKIRAAIKVECDRQNVGEDRKYFLRQSYDFLRYYTIYKAQTLNENLLLGLACDIEPINKGQFRTTPVSFNGIVGGVPPELVPHSMDIWLDYFNHNLTPIGIDSDIVRVNHVIKEFLDIHPFIDGNGRIAWLLRVWMLNQWDDPQPLPDYYPKG